VCKETAIKKIAQDTSPLQYKRKKERKRKRRHVARLEVKALPLRSRPPKRIEPETSKQRLFFGFSLRHSYSIFSFPKGLYLVLFGTNVVDWVSLVDEESAVVSDNGDAGVVSRGAGGVGVPDGFAALGVENTVAVTLHNKALNVVSLLLGVLPAALAAPVDSDLAVTLHLELDAAVLAEETVADHQPLAVAEGVAGSAGRGFRHGG